MSTPSNPHFSLFCNPITGMVGWRLVDLRGVEICRSSESYESVEMAREHIRRMPHYFRNAPMVELVEAPVTGNTSTDGTDL